MPSNDDYFIERARREFRNSTQHYEDMLYAYQAGAAGNEAFRHALEREIQSRRNDLEIKAPTRAV